MGGHLLRSALPRRAVAATGGAATGGAAASGAAERWHRTELHPRPLRTLRPLRP